MPMVNHVKNILLMGKSKENTDLTASKHSIVYNSDCKSLIKRNQYDNITYEVISCSVHIYFKVSYQIKNLQELDFMCLIGS